ncbi:Uncharacterized protein FWK35_00014211 [Aphis craccivora]|uniref:Uncharacterized protein n=1 Tax=Aphis craccivora TaxID=307492 RepID=A0A6G0YEL6_APHCR|nr:Uncharacterized protein FWK35_00014211 [Aphis craccivora]
MLTHYNNIVDSIEHCSNLDDRILIFSTWKDLEYWNALFLEHCKCMTVVYNYLIEEFIIFLLGVEIIFYGSLELSDDCIGILDSESSDEFIDFTMLCVFFFFFVPVYMKKCQNNALISNFLVHSGGHFLIFQIVFKCARKNQKKKINEKREFLHKISFGPNRFFYMIVIQKIIIFLISSSYIQILTKILIKELKFWFIQAIKT